MQGVLLVSFKCRPARWIWGIIPLALPFLGASYLNSPVMVDKIADNAKANFSRAQDMANLKLVMDGRDAKLSGEAESQAAIDKAAKSVLATYGVRRVETDKVKIVQPVVLDIPVVNPVSGNSNKPIVTGKWPEGIATTLSVKLADKTYTLGKDAELTSDGNGNWRLQPSQPVADGVHDVSVTITDGKKAAAVDASSNEVSVDTTAPAAPTIATKLVTKNPRPTIAGTWAHKDANSLAIALIGPKTTRDHVLGKADALKTDDRGNWTLTPEKDLPDGRYDIKVTTADKLGNASSTTAKAALTIDTTAPATGSVMVSQGADPKPQLTGTWPKATGNTLTVTVEGQKYTLGKDKALTVDDNGNWFLKLKKALTPGKHTVTVTSSDALGNESSMTAPGVVVVDKTPPAAPTIVSAINATTAPVFKGTWSEKAGNSLRVVVAGKVFALGRDKQLTSDGKGNWTLSLSQPLADGTHAILAESSDAYGNLSRSEKPTAVVVDTTRPDKPTINQQTTRSKSPAITGTWPEDDKNTLNVAFAGRNYQLGKDAALKSDGRGSWTLTPAAPLADGAYGVIATVTDQAGNKAVAESPKGIIVDTTGPKAPTVSKIATTKTSPLVAGTWDAAESADLTVKIDNKTYALSNQGEINVSGNNWSLTPTKALAEGRHDVTVTTQDKVGNTSSTTVADAITVDTTPPARPTVTTVLTRSRQPLITGSWDSSDAVDLQVKVAGQTYIKGKSSELEVNGDHWSVKPVKPIADGIHDVVVTVGDKLGNATTDTEKGELVIDGTSPAIPTIRPVFGTNKRPPIGGTWPEDGENSLSVSIDGNAYVLSKDGPLTSDGSGNWRLKLAKDLAPGSYDVKVKVADRMGNQSHDNSVGEIWVKEAKKPEPPKPVEPAKTVPEKKTPDAVQSAKTCQMEFTAALSGQNIRFQTNKTSLTAGSNKLVAKLANIAKACPKAKIEVSGHTDSRGSKTYNQALSEGRASAVVDALVTQGIEKSRLRAVGYGEQRPIADNRTKEGQAANRRIEFKVED